MPDVCSLLAWRKEKRHAEPNKYLEGKKQGILILDMHLFTIYLIEK